MEERLQKYMASAGVGSRRACEAMIAEGKVEVNGQIVREQGVKVVPGKDKVKVNGKLIAVEDKHVYILLNKPVDYITTVKDTHERPIVTDLLRDIPYRVYPVGRLDVDTEGLLLLTNDGEFSYRMTHPKFQIKKTYLAVVQGVLTEERIATLEQGVMLEDGKTAPAKVEVVRREKHKTVVKITISEGRNRQVRRMFKAVKNPVLALRRISIGPLTLDKVPIGEYRYLTEKELHQLGSRLGLNLIQE